MEYADRTQPTSEIVNSLSSISSIKTEDASTSQPMQVQTEAQAPPPSEYDALTAQLVENPHSPDRWRNLIRIAEDSGDIEKISAAYDALLKQYPNNVRVCCAVVPYVYRLTLYFNLGDCPNPIYKSFCE